ncbi:MAG: molybdopterin converting factor subunit 1 [Kordiimonadaceae bacterium]|jgi:sulfur-carrier protein|nr:molybdopterin converting factor subunit 1 [Kordiimonadaceae bacterium]
MNLVYFALIRENIGKSSQSIDLPEGVTTTGELIDHLSTLGDNYNAAFAQSDLIRIAVNQEYVGLDHPVTDRDEVAIFPPMTGG